MSLLVPSLLQTDAAAAQREAIREGRALYRLRLVKWTCLLLLGVALWFSVPYSLSHVETTDRAEAAAIEAAAYAGNASRQASMPLLAAVCLFMLWRLPRIGRFRSRLLWLGALYCAIAAFSVFWSDDPSITVKRLVVFAMDVLCIVTMASRLTTEELAGFGFVATTAVLLISFGLDLVNHKLAPGDPDYRFAGVMSPNFQAMNIIASLLCGLTLVQQKLRRFRWMAPLIVVELGLLYLTRARVGTILAIVLAVIFAWRILHTQMQTQSRAILLGAALAVTLPGLIYVAGSKGADAAQSAFMLGRNDTEATSNLSNRAPLWAELSDEVNAHPWLGFGYNAFWLPVRVEKISLDQGWTVPNGHNTFLDQTLSLGYVGAAVYTVMVLGALVMAWRRTWADRRPESLLLASLLLWLVCNSFTESMPLDPFLPTLLAYTAVVAMMRTAEAEPQAEIEDESGALAGPAQPRRLQAVRGAR